MSSTRSDQTPPISNKEIDVRSVTQSCVIKPVEPATFSDETTHISNMRGSAKSGEERDPSPYMTEGDMIGRRRGREEMWKQDSLIKENKDHAFFDTKVAHSTRSGSTKRSVHMNGSSNNKIRSKSLPKCSGRKTSKSESSGGKNNNKEKKTKKTQQQQQQDDTVVSVILNSLQTTQRIQSLSARQGGDTSTNISALSLGSARPYSAPRQKLLHGQYGERKDHSVASDVGTDAVDRATNRSAGAGSSGGTRTSYQSAPIALGCHNSSSPRSRTMSPGRPKRQWQRTSVAEQEELSGLSSRTGRDVGEWYHSLHMNEGKNSGGGSSRGQHRRQDSLIKGEKDQAFFDAKMGANNKSSLLTDGGNRKKTRSKSLPKFWRRKTSKGERSSSKKKKERKIEETQQRQNAPIVSGGLTSLQPSQRLRSHSTRRNRDSCTNKSPHLTGSLRPYSTPRQGLHFIQNFERKVKSAVAGTKTCTADLSISKGSRHTGAGSGGSAYISHHSAPSATSRHISRRPRSLSPGRFERVKTRNKPGGAPAGSSGNTYISHQSAPSVTSRHTSRRPRSLSPGRFERVKTRNKPGGAPAGSSGNTYISHQSAPSVTSRHTSRRPRSLSPGRFERVKTRNKPGGASPELMSLATAATKQESSCQQTVEGCDSVVRGTHHVDLNSKNGCDDDRSRMSASRESKGMGGGANNSPQVHQMTSSRTGAIDIASGREGQQSREAQQLALGVENRTVNNSGNNMQQGISHFSTPPSTSAPKEDMAPMTTARVDASNLSPTLEGETVTTRNSDEFKAGRREESAVATTTVAAPMGAIMYLEQRIEEALDGLSESCNGQGKDQSKRNQQSG